MKKVLTIKKINGKEVIETSKQNAINSNGVLLVGKIKPVKKKNRVVPALTMEDVEGPLVRMGVLKIAF